jgi:hypothetical protein
MIFALAALLLAFSSLLWTIAAIVAANTSAPPLKFIIAITVSASVLVMAIVQLIKTSK